MLHIVLLLLLLVNLSSVSAVDNSGCVTTAAAGGICGRISHLNYRNNEQLSWSRAAPQGFLVELRITYLHMENCCDWLILLGDSGTIQRFNGRNAQQALRTVVREKSIQIRFTSDYSVTRGGFIITCRMVPDNRPAITTTAGSSRSCSALTHSNYGNNENFRWTRTAPPGYIVELRITFLNMEACCDYLILETSSERYRFNGRNRNAALNSLMRGRHIVIRFTSDGSVTGGGFRISCQLVADNGQYTTTNYWNRYNTSNPWHQTTTTYNWHRTSTAANVTEVEITSNVLDHRNHTNNEQRRWTKTAPPGSIIEARVTYLHLENCCDHLNIKSSDSRSWSRASSGSVFRGRQIQISFTSDSSVARDGFTVQFRVRPEGSWTTVDWNNNWHTTRSNNNNWRTTGSWHNNWRTTRNNNNNNWRTTGSWHNNWRTTGSWHNNWRTTRNNNNWRTTGSWHNNWRTTRNNNNNNWRTTSSWHNNWTRR